MLMKPPPLLVAIAHVLLMLASMPRRAFAILILPSPRQLFHFVYAVSSSSSTAAAGYYFIIFTYAYESFVFTPVTDA